MTRAVFFVWAVALVCIVLTQGSSGAEPIKEPSVTYEEMDVPGGKVLLAVARPASPGKGPALLILHGTHGFATDYVQIAREVASAGYVAVAACWFAPGTGPGMRFISPKPCPTGAPPIVRGDETNAQKRVAAIVAVVASLPGVDRGRVVLMGHSRGGGAALYYALGGGPAEGIILNSGPYPPDAIERVSAITAPVLILHGEKDGPSDGGSEMTSATRARAFVSALKLARVRVTANFYPEGSHNSLFTDPVQHRAAIKAIVRYLRGISRGRASDSRVQDPSK